MGGNDNPRKRPEHWGSMQWGDFSKHPQVSGRQDILNSAGYHEPDHDCWPPIPVEVRIEWSVDGEEWIKTQALGWKGKLVYVELRNPRNRTVAVWLNAEDVRRL